MKTVERIIGYKPGTGGTAGVSLPGQGAASQALSGALGGPDLDVAPRAPAPQVLPQPRNRAAAPVCRVQQRLAVSCFSIFQKCSTARMRDQIDQPVQRLPAPAQPPHHPVGRGHGQRHQQQQRRRTQGDVGPLDDVLSDLVPVKSAGTGPGRRENAAARRRRRTGRACGAGASGCALRVSCRTGVTSKREQQQVEGRSCQACRARSAPGRRPGRSPARG